MTTMLEYVARYRTWIANLIFSALVLLPEIVTAPEILAVIPDSYQRWVIAAGFLVNIWMRPRPAVLPSDPEVKIKAALGEFTGEQGVGDA